MKRILLVCLTAVFAFASSELWAQERTVSGRVTSVEDGSGLPGVNVVVKGTTVGTVTDIDGKYSLTVPAGNGTLVFTFIGLTTQEIEIGDRSSIDVPMSQDAKQLNEVVVTALGISREKESIGYAVTQVGGEDLSQVNQTNVVNSLSGRVAGVQVTGASGNMGGSSRVTIRGINSITGNNSPLFVVDGIIINNSDYNSVNTARGAGGYDYGNLAQDINPEDIASVSVLKGPNAAALYGSRGANGVIMITTKKGSRKGLGVKINSGVSFDKIFILPKYQRLYGGGIAVPDADGGVQGFTQQNINGTDYLLVDYATDESWGPRYAGQQVLHWNSFDSWDTQNYLKPREWKAPDNDVRSFFNTGVTVTNNVELTGGDENSGFRLSYTRMDLKGYMPNSKLDRNTINFSGNTKLGKVVEAFTNFNYVKNEATGRPSTGYDDNNIMQKFNQWGQRQLDMEELKAYKNPDGSQRTWNRVSWDDATPNYSDNPYWTRYENYQNDTRNRFYGNVGAQVTLANWLKVKTTVNADYYNLREMERVAIGSQAQPKYYEGLREFLETNAEVLFLFNKKIGQDFDLVGNLGGNRMDQHYSSNLAQTQGGLVLPNFYNLSNAVSGVAVTDYDRRKRINSLYGSFNIGYKNTLYLELMGRNDWSSALTPPTGGANSDNSYFYPAVNTSFVFTNMPALNSIGWLNEGKIRAGWAKVGNDTDAYNNNLIYKADLNDDGYPYTFGGIPLYGVSNTKNNPDLQPEDITSFEVGTQLGFFDNRVGLDFTYYTKKSTNLILPLQVSGATGVSFVYVNSAEMTNKGFEVMLTGTPVRMENGLQWDIAINWAKNENEITQLYEDLQTYSLTNAPFSVTLNAMVGESYGSIRGTDFLYDSEGNKVVNANGRYRASAIKTIGNILPDWTGGITNTLRFKGIELSALIDIRHGGEFFSTTHMWGTYSGILERTAANNIREDGIVVDGAVVQLVNGNPVVNEDGTVQTSGPNTTSISAVRWAADHYSGPAKQNVFDASYVKLREVRLGYTIPSRFTGPIKNVRVSAYGRNLAIWGSDATDFADPENTTSSGNVQGIEGGALPSLRTYGFNVSFGL